MTICSEFLNESIVWKPTYILLTSNFTLLFVIHTEIREFLLPALNLPLSVGWTHEIKIYLKLMKETVRI